MSQRQYAVIVVDPEGTPRSNNVFRLFASPGNAKKKIREEHKYHDKLRAVRLDRYGDDIGDWPKPRIFEICFTEDGRLEVTAEIE